MKKVALQSIEEAEMQIHIPLSITFTKIKRK